MLKSFFFQQHNFYIPTLKMYLMHYLKKTITISMQQSFLFLSPNFTFTKILSLQLQKMSICLNISERRLILKEASFIRVFITALILHLSPWELVKLNKILFIYCERTSNTNYQDYFECALFPTAIISTQTPLYIHK